MILVVGGYSQGKLDFVKEQFHVSDECVFDSALPTKEEREKLISEKRKPVIHNLHKWIRK